MSNIAVNPFVKRQTEFSQFSYFKGSWGELVDLTSSYFLDAREGDKKGSLLVPIGERDVTLFMTGTTKIGPESILTPHFKPRREGEEPYLSITAVGPKMPAKKVDIVLYTHNLLGEDASSQADYEIISINASVYKNEPMDPVTMMRNFLERPGGTKAVYTAEEFAWSIHFHSQHALVTPT